MCFNKAKYVHIWMFVNYILCMQDIVSYHVSSFLLSALHKFHMKDQHSPTDHKLYVTRSHIIKESMISTIIRCMCSETNVLTCLSLAEKT